MSNEPEWYSRSLRRIFFDMHLPDWTQPGQSGGRIGDPGGVASAFDTDAIISEFARARINLAIVFAKCQYGNFYYDTRIGHKHRGLGDLDLLGEIVDKARRYGIRIIGYYSNMWDTQVAREHPEWMARDASGNASYNRWPRLCLNSPYRELVHEHLREMFTLYNLDGLWSDILTDLPCFCDRCRSLYEKAFGDAMPLSADDRGWIQMLRWQQDYIYEYISGCRNVVKELRPEAAFIINYYGTPYAKPSQGLSFKHLALSDIGSSEGYTEWHGLLFPSYAARYMRAGMSGRPFEVLTGRFVNTWDFTVRSLAQMRFEAFSVAANGGAVCVDDEPYHDGRLEPLLFDQLENIYNEVERREPFLFGAEPTPYAALYHSQKGRELDEVINKPRPTQGSALLQNHHNPSDSDLLPSLMGSFKAMLEAHIPLQFVDDRGESLDTLSRFKVVYLPNILTLSEEEAERLRAFVHEGGGLVATGATSLYDDQGRRLDNFQLADLFGVDLVGRGRYSFPYFEFSDSPLTSGLGGRPLPHYAAMWRVRVNSPDVAIAATRRDPLIETCDEVYYHNNQPPPGPDTCEPALVHRQVGKGRVVYCAGLPESNYARLGYGPYRCLIDGMIRWAAGCEPSIGAKGLLNTEIVATRLGNDLIVHLITGFAQRPVHFDGGRSAETIDEIAVLHDVRLTIPPGTTQARRLPDGPLYPISRDGSEVTITLPTAGDWEMVQLVDALSSGEGGRLEDEQESPRR